METDRISLGPSLNNSPAPLRPLYSRRRVPLPPEEAAGLVTADVALNPDQGPSRVLQKPCMTEIYLHILCAQYVPQRYARLAATSQLPGANRRAQALFPAGRPLLAANYGLFAYNP